jgi:hypothetical protein
MSDSGVVRLFVAALALLGAAVLIDLCIDDKSEPDDLHFDSAPAWVMDRDERNRNGDCRNTHAECSDDDQLAVVVCVEPDSCRFG